MDSSSGISSNSSGLQNSGSEKNLQLLLDQRKRKRMISNRESARRSRLRKQKRLDDLMSQVAHLRKENHRILTGLNLTTQHYHNVEAENAVIRAQAAELSHRLQSLTEIASFVAGFGGFGGSAEEAAAYDMAEISAWNYCFGINASQPIIMDAGIQYGF